MWHRYKTIFTEIAIIISQYYSNVERKKVADCFLNDYNIGINLKLQQSQEVIKGRFPYVRY